MNERESIRFRLMTYKLSSAWLINQLANNGVVTDRASMSAILAGTRRGPKADLVIQKSIEILDGYEAVFGNGGACAT